MILTAENLTKKFDTFCAVDHVSFSIPKGVCFGFLGPNGAGKTTTIKMIYGAFLPSEGVVKLFGLSTKTHRKEIKRRLGVVHQQDILDLSLDVWDNLYVYGRYFRLSREEVRREGEVLLEMMELSGRTKEPVSRFSGGMKRRLSIVKSLIPRPDFLLLDEPTTGLDPQSRHRLWDFVRSLKERGVTILLTTHYMEEAERLCDDLIIMDHGKILEQGAPKDLVTKHRCSNLEEVFLRLTGKGLRDD